MVLKFDQRLSHAINGTVIWKKLTLLCSNFLQTITHNYEWIHNTEEKLKRQGETNVRTRLCTWGYKKNR